MVLRTPGHRAFRLVRCGGGRTLQYTCHELRRSRRALIVDRRSPRRNAASAIEARSNHFQEFGAEKAAPEPRASLFERCVLAPGPAVRICVHGAGIRRFTAAFVTLHGTKTAGATRPKGSGKLASGNSRARQRTGVSRGCQLGAPSLRQRCRSRACPPSARKIVHVRPPER